jgi:hypothetical protein
MTYGLLSIDPRGVRLMPGDHVTAWTGGILMKCVWDRSSAAIRTSNRKTDFFLIPIATLFSGNNFP